MTSQEALVVVEQHEGWSEIALNRPQRKNALTGPLVEALRAAVAAIGRDSPGSVILLRGAGGAFCSGLDLKEFGADPQPAWVAEFPSRWAGLHRQLYAYDGLIVGALERYAINGGAALALACDFLVAGNGAFLQVGEARMARPAPINFAWLFLRGGRRLVTEVALRAERLPGSELHRLGLAHEVAPDGEVVERARALAQSLAELPSGTIAGMKRLLARLEETSGLADPFGLVTAADAPRERAEE